MVYRKLTSKSSDLRANNKVEKEKSGGTREKVSQRLRFESQEKKSVIERKKEKCLGEIDRRNVHENIGKHTEEQASHSQKYK